MQPKILDYPNTPSFYASSLPPPPPANSNEKPSHTNTFVHKLYNMVVDTHYQHLISWSYPGTSFIVCNLLEFSKDVLPKHFKHNNFSSFVRQLNMYGFHKVNKSPRGHRTLAENQIWEFSHQQFLRNRPDLLDEIKRKTLEPERKEVPPDMMVMQASQAELVQHMQTLYANLNQAMKDLQAMRQVQDEQARVLKAMAHSLAQSSQPPTAAQEALKTTPHLFVTPANTLGPPSPSPSMLLSDDEFDTLYHPRLYAYPQ
ncbi:HSF-type DNA-binding-domain-containing protein [Sporodiniella umbellata]|nr:HSF-type DNA-binding-domain-containing protein [Sporodiniella umbellata]